MSKLADQLTRDEKPVAYVYDDATGKPITKGSIVIGYPTIGIGRMVDKNMGGGLSDDEQKYLLSNDIARISRELALTFPWTTELDEVRRGALQNMAFQLGLPKLKGFKKTLELIRTGQYMAASQEMLNSTWAQQTPQRAQRLSKQILTGEWQ